MGRPTHQGRLRDVPVPPIVYFWSCIITHRKEEMVEYNKQPEGNPNRGYLLNFSPKSGQVQHQFCGTHSIKGAACPNCRRPLMRVLSLSAKDAVLNLDPAKTPLVHLLYCWTCSIPFGEFSYMVNSDESVKLLQVPERKPDSEFGLEGPYEGYTGVYPLQEIALDPMDEEDDAKLNAARMSEGEYDLDDDLFEPRHQVGGSPFIYNSQTIMCPNCSKEMPLLAALCNDATGNAPWNSEESNTFTGNGGVQMVFQFCRDCAIVSAYHSCD